MSPDDPKDHPRTVIVAPTTGMVAVDRLCSVRRERRVQRLGAQSDATVSAVLEWLTEFFAP